MCIIILQNCQIKICNNANEELQILMPNVILHLLPRIQPFDVLKYFVTWMTMNIKFNKKKKKG
jgi:hypothetical protein